MAERLARTAPPRTAKYPAKRAIFFVCAGIAAVLCGVGFAVKALTTHTSSANGTDPGRIAAGLAGGGVFAASLGAPALKRQAAARDALSRWAKSNAFTLHGADECRGEVAGVPLAVRIAYGRGPYASRGASELLVVVRPRELDAVIGTSAPYRSTPARDRDATGAPVGWLSDSEPFDDGEVALRHIERLVARAVRRASPADES